MKNRLLLRSGLAALLALLNACGGGGDSPSNPDAPAITAVAAGQQASQTLGAAGGTVQLATREGARFTLTVPAGAVPEGTLLALETAAPAAGRRMHLRLSPAGLVPAVPLELTLVLPPSLALPSGAALVYDRAPLPFTRQSDGSLQLRLPALAGGSAIAAGTGRALARAVPQQAASPVPACSGVPVLDTTPDGGLADSAPIVADDYGSCMLGAVNALATSGEYAEAVRLASSIGAYLQSIGAANTDGLSTRFLTEARSLACTAYGRVIDAAAAASVTSYDGLVPLVKPVLLWEMAVQQLGAVCPGVAPGRYLTVVENLTSAALGYYTSQQGTVVDVASPAYAQALRETRAGNATVAQVRSLDAPAALQTLARTQIRERAQPALLSSVLQAPWQRCRDSGNFDKLIELMQLMDQPAAVKTAAQYCATQLSAQARDTAGAVTATLDAQLGGVAAGEQRTGGTLAVAVDGKLELSGPIRALQCPAGSGGGSESLQLKLGSTVLQTITAAPYLPDTLQVDIAQALRAAGIAASTFSSAALTLSRSGSPCGGFWGENPEPLLTLNLSAGLCMPKAGYQFCITPIVRSDGSAVDGDAFPWAAAINDKAEVLFKLRTFDNNAVGARVWTRGAVRDLPAGFGVANGRPRLNNGGTAVGLCRGAGARNDGEDAGVALPDGRVATLPLPDYPAGMAAYSRAIRFDEGPPVITDSGSIFGTALVAGPADAQAVPAGCEAAQYCYYGYVLRWDPPYDRYTVLDGPIYYSDPQLVLDADAAGVAVGRRVSRELQYGVPYQWNPGAAVDQPDTRGRALLRDDHGATWWLQLDADTQAETLRVTRQPPHLATSALAELKGISKAGFAQLCGNSTGNQLKLVHLYDGREWSMQAASLVDPALGWDFAALTQGCDAWGIGPGDINRHGQLLVHATRQGVFTPAILTPRGQPLP